MPFGEYLTRRLRWWESEAELKPSTLASYREAIELYFRPGLGHVRLADLRDHHFRDLSAAMRLINRPEPGRRPKRHAPAAARAARGERHGKRLDPPAIGGPDQRMHAVAQRAVRCRAAYPPVTRPPR